MVGYDRCPRSSEFVALLGLYYYKARMYSPQLGRFLQTDPVGSADDLNLYAYVGNNPVNYTDPTQANGMGNKKGSRSGGKY